MVAGSFRQFSLPFKIFLQQITIKAEMHRGEGEEEETKVNFLKSFIILATSIPSNLASYHPSILAA